jgi:hypothetical protein
MALCYAGKGLEIVMKPELAPLRLTLIDIFAALIPGLAWYVAALTTLEFVSTTTSTDGMTKVGPVVQTNICLV